jgi:hypothetical protein
MDDPRIGLIKELNLNSCRVVQTDSPVVLLCGGRVETKSSADASDPPIQSLRHAISLEFSKFELFRPEEITTWQNDAVFRNLVDFETELAAICSLVVIILESAGSIAELGAFSQLEELRNKLVVIKSSFFSEKDYKDSFINLGILRYIQEKNRDGIKVYPWDIGNPEAIEKEIIQDALKGIEDSLLIIPDTQVLKIDREAHATTVVCELIRIFVALKRNEILNYVRTLGFTMDDKKLRRKLFLLENFQLVKVVEYDGTDYYCRTESTYHKLRLSTAGSRKLEDVKIILDCNAYYERTNDRHRLGAIKRFKKENSQ